MTHNLVLEVYPTGSFPKTRRNLMFHSLCDLVTEHLGAMIYLTQSGCHYGSAFALLRPLLETYLRSLWVINNASEDQLKAIARSEKNFPGFEACRAAAENNFKQQGVTGLYVFDKEFIETLHGFTHSGVEQLVQRFDSTGTPSPHTYSDYSVVNVLDQASRFAIQAAIMHVQAFEGSPVDLSPKIASLVDRFNQIVPETSEGN